jgi:hypothetical protein
METGLYLMNDLGRTRDESQAFTGISEIELLTHIGDVRCLNFGS